MTSDALSVNLGRTGQLGEFKPPWRIVLFAIGTLFAFSSGRRQPSPSPPRPASFVGRDRVLLVDASQPETHTPAVDDVRSVPLQLWYPAEAGTGATAEYVDGLDDIATGLTASGALSGIEVAALPLVRTNAFDGATVAPGSHPVIVLSPGNETNVAFYGSLAEGRNPMGIWLSVSIIPSRWRRLPSPPARSPSTTRRWTPGIWARRWQPRSRRGWPT